MKITVTGPGALGCYLSARLIEAGHDVCLLDNDPQRAQFLCDRGILVEEGGADRTVPVKAVSSSSCAGQSDLIFICVKSYDTAQAVDDSSGAIGDETLVASLQNGFGNVELISAKVGPARTIAVVTGHGVTSLDTGHVRHAGAGRTSVAALDSAFTERADRVAGCLTDAGIKSHVAEDAYSLIWSKLVVNAAINPLTAVSEVANGVLLENEGLRELMQVLAKEAASVARAQGVELLYQDEQAEVERVCRDTATNISSMLQDIRAGRRTEIESITGVIIAKARELNIDVPASEVVFQQVKDLPDKD